MHEVELLNLDAEAVLINAKYSGLTVSYCCGSMLTSPIFSAALQAASQTINVSKFSYDMINEPG